MPCLEPTGTRTGNRYQEETEMPIIDMHAHVTPDRFKKAVSETGSWYGLGPRTGELHRPGGFNSSTAERLAEMDKVGIDIALITPNAGFYQYDNELATTIAIARECNDSIAEIVVEYPRRFAGLGTLPMQDTPSAITELERAVGDLGLNGVMVDDHVNGLTWDNPRFLPFFEAAEAIGALIFFHQGGDTCVRARIDRYSLPNAVGNLTERALSFAALVFGGVMDKHPNLKVLLGHGGGFAPFGASRMDKVAGAFESAYPETGLQPPFGRGSRDYVLSKPPSSYLPQFYYDCCVYTAPALRFLIDAVGIDRVVLGTDAPAPMYLIDAVTWINELKCLSPAEKQAILADNATALLGL